MAEDAATPEDPTTGNPGGDDSSIGKTGPAAESSARTEAGGAHRAPAPRKRRSRIRDAATLGLILTVVGTLIAMAALARDYFDLTAPTRRGPGGVAHSPAESVTPSTSTGPTIDPAPSRSVPTGADRRTRPTSPSSASGAEIPPTDPERVAVRTSYNLGAGEGAVDRVLRAGGSISQDFIAATPTVTWGGVIAGCNPQLSGGCGADGSSFGTLTLEILDGGQTLGAAVVDTSNNRTSEGRFDHEVQVTPGGRYTLRVTNTAGKPIGFYVNRPPTGDDLLTTISNAFHPVDNGPSELDLCALVDNRP
ncbi:hypothetical protein [Cryptosporangium sp. NPDC051539]|uniref:hypothetical protein n=1 Tax=Cryptosporangium sp. NPDC051539 TaxID=3363962 RepID=UPI0037A1BA4A